ncbi:MAG: CapA family protein [Reyranella sp.]
MRIFLCGDVMLGRGIDQALPHPCAPEIHEMHMNSALGYLRLAERAHGSIGAPLEPSQVWGAALEEFGRMRPEARIVNLETSITRCEHFQPKGINYRMSPENAQCLASAGIDCCALANNHVLDWGRAGLVDTLEALDGLGIRHSGAGRDAAAAALPAVVDCTCGIRVLVFSVACLDAGIPPDWAATPAMPGVNLLPDLSRAAVASLGDLIGRYRRQGDVVILSIHWGSNWGYTITDTQRQFAHDAIDRAGVSIVHGHSSHHARAIEVHAGRLILYGCGDFINDYEGISGYEEYRGDLSVMYFPEVDPTTGTLVGLDLVPLQVRRFRLEHPCPDDVAWLAKSLGRQSRDFGARVTADAQRLRVAW